MCFVLNDASFYHLKENDITALLAIIQIIQMRHYKHWRRFFLINHFYAKNITQVFARFCIIQNNLIVVYDYASERPLIRYD